MIFFGSRLPLRCSYVSISSLVTDSFVMLESLFPSCYVTIIKMLYLFLQGERKLSALLCISLAFSLHVVGIYWWYRNDDLLYPLVMLPPKAIPPFWHAIFIIMVNGAFSSLNYCNCFHVCLYKGTRRICFVRVLLPPLLNCSSSFPFWNFRTLSSL